MSYKDKFGITKIRTKEESERDVMSLSIDEDHFSDTDEVVPVILYIPYYPEHDHSHITLNRNQATKLRDWLNEYLADPDPAQKLKDDMKKHAEDVARKKNS